VTYNGCKFTYNALTIENGKFEGSADITCPETGAIEIAAPSCTITIPAQQNLKKLTYTNTASGKDRDITVDLNITGLIYLEDKTAPLFKCVDAGKTKTNGTIAGGVVLAAEKEGKSIGFWVE
jgi:hypothetical protein